MGLFKKNKKLPMLLCMLMPLIQNAESPINHWLHTDGIKTLFADIRRFGRLSNSIRVAPR